MTPKTLVRSEIHSAVLL